MKIADPHRVLLVSAGGVGRKRATAIAADRVLRAGYNHRFRPAIAGLHAAASQGRLGPLISVRGRYGHGGRPGYDCE